MGRGDHRLRGVPFLLYPRLTQATSYWQGAMPSTAHQLS